MLVLDGNQKNNCPVCAAEGAGFICYDGLPGKVKTGCMNTPEQQSVFCSLHKPRRVDIQPGDPESQATPRGKVIEMILSKKQTRSGAYYQVIVFACK